jgi:hypothetical protein
MIIDYVAQELSISLGLTQIVLPSAIPLNTSSVLEDLLNFRFSTENIVAKYGKGVQGSFLAFAHHDDEIF